jgi:hypothetical protein
VVLRDGRNHHDGQRNASRQRREMFLAHHDQAVGDDADHDRGHAVQHIGDKAHDIAIAVAPVLGKKDARADPKRHAEHTGNPKNNHRAHNRVRHAAAGLAYWFRSLRKETQD